MDTVYAYKDRDNSFWIVFKRNNVTLTAIEMATITNIAIRYKDVYYSLAENPTGFTRDDANGRFKILPYNLDLPVGRDIVEVILYDASDNVHGLVWDSFELVVFKNVALPTTTAPTTLPPTTLAPTTV